MSNLEITERDIELEKLRRLNEEADRLQSEFAPWQPDGLWKFCQYCYPDFYLDSKEPLRELCSILQRITQGELKKVLVSFAPRMGKSRTCTMWIVWWLGYDPQASFMRNSYGDGLAMELSKACIDQLGTEKYHNVFPLTKLDYKASSKEGWQLEGTTIKSYFGAGLTGQITGKGCKSCAILDDPIKNPSDALSESFLDTLELLIETVHNTRIDHTAGCAELIICTRWAEKDPIGMREKEEGWTKFIFPMLDENDKSICEDMMPTEKLLTIRETWRKRNLMWMFDALFMCQPGSKSLSKIPLDKLHRFSMKDLEEVEIDEVVGVCDYANKGSDYLSSPFASRVGNRKYITDVLFSNADSETLLKELGLKIIANRPHTYVVESNQGGVEFATMLERDFGKYFDALDIEIESRSESTNKEIRILLRLGEIKNDCYFLVDEEQDENYRRFFNSLAAYGKYKYGKDDAPDSMAALLGVMGDVCDVNVEFIGRNAEILDNKSDSSGNDTEDDTDDDVIVF